MSNETERPDLDPTRSRAPEPTTRFPDLPRTHVGDYRIVRRIGGGGMGVVFEAEQQHPRRPVALKVIRGGSYVDEHHVRLFQREAQALARLKHPSIAAIYETGRTEDGQHFFAMELVRGVSLSEHIRSAWSERPPSRPELNERLRLFVKICDAVNYAHQRGVIHRDLKPSNIIVVSGPGTRPSGSSSETTPDIKILDFGLARITDADVAVSSVWTDAGRIQGTFSYMSPEQARGNPDDVDLRCDVYSLGVILYEMMTGEMPYDVTGTQPHEAVRAICEDRPRPPRRVLKDRKQPYRLDRDLETIALKALEKEPWRRYQSALALSEDVERYLDDEPILARPPSAVYQFRKLVARHKAAFAFLTAMFVLVAGSALLMTIERNKALAAEELARKEEAKSKAVTEFLQKMLSSPNPGQDGREVKVVDVLDRAAATVKSDFDSQPEMEATVHATLGETYASLGQYDRAQTHMELAVDIRKRVLGEEHPDTLAAMGNLAAALYYQGKFTDAVELARETLTLKERVLGEDDEETLSARVDLGAFLNAEGKFEEAEQIYRDLLDSRLQSLGEDHRLVLTSLNNLGFSLKQQGKLAEAERFYRRSLDVRLRVLGEDHPDTLDTMANLGILLDNEGKLEEAEQVLRRALQVRRTVLGEEHPDTITSMNLLALNLCSQEKYQQARKLFDEVIALARSNLSPDHYRFRIYQGNYGQCLTRMGRYAEAEKLHLESYSGLKAALGDSASRTKRAIQRLIDLYEAWGKPGKAAQYRPLLAKAADGQP